MARKIKYIVLGNGQALKGFRKKTQAKKYGQKLADRNPNDNFELITLK